MNISLVKPYLEKFKDADFLANTRIMRELLNVKWKSNGFVNGKYGEAMKLSIPRSQRKALRRWFRGGSVPNRS